MDARHPNFVANTGTMDGVRITGGSTTEPDKDIAVEVREDATQFGDALSIYPKKTYSGNLAAIPVHKPEGFDFSKTKGLAVYIKFPTTAMATNLSIRLIKDDWSQWFEIGTSVTLTTLSVMGEKKSVSQFLPFEDMQGFEGFVFIPYEALYAGSPGQVDFDLLNSWEDWSIEIGYYKPNEADANVDYLYDNFGFYSDPEEYAALCGFVAQDKPQRRRVFQLRHRRSRLVPGQQHAGYGCHHLRRLRRGGVAHRRYPGRRPACSWRVRRRSGWR